MPAASEATLFHAWPSQRLVSEFVLSEALVVLPTAQQSAVDVQVPDENVPGTDRASADISGDHAVPFQCVTTGAGPPPTAQQDGVPGQGMAARKPFPAAGARGHAAP